VLLARRERVEAELFELALESPNAETVRNLRCPRGIDTLSAVGLCCEMLDFERFRAKQLGSFLGLVPSEDSTGEEQRAARSPGPAQSTRRLLVEAAWHYRHHPYVSDKLRRRQQGCDPRAIDIAWRAQRRLYSRGRRLAGERGKLETKVAVAEARGLSCFCWEIATLDR
jgi:transposase